MRNRRVLIIGAGIAGLASALSLSRTGWQVEVVERAPGLRGGAYVVGFSGTGYDAAEQLGLLPQLQRLASPWQPLQQVDGDGRVLAQLSVRAQQAMSGRRIISILRGDLERVLDEACGDRIERRFGVSVDDLAQSGDSVTARLSDGTSTTVDLVIGADGLHSSIRNLTFGPESLYRKDFGADVVSFALADPPPEIAERTTLLTLLGRSIGVYPQPDGRLAVFCVYATDPSAGASDPAEAIGRVFGDLGWVWPEVINRVGQADSVFSDSISQIRMPNWSRGRVVLLGDAAWAVSLVAGYGSSLAVGGAKLLGDALQHGIGLSDSLSAWEKQLRPRVRRKQLQGRWTRDLFIPRTRAAVAVRHAALRLAQPLFSVTMY